MDIYSFKTFVPDRKLLEAVYVQNRSILANQKKILREVIQTKSVASFNQNEPAAPQVEPFPIALPINSIDDARELEVAINDASIYNQLVRWCTKLIHVYELWT